MPDEAEPPPRQFTFKEAEFESVNAPEEAGAPAANDPLAILQANRAHEKANNTVYDQTPAISKKMSHRLRDYFVGLVVINLLMGVLLSPVPIFQISAILIFTGGWSWTMLVVVDDY